MEYVFRGLDVLLSWPAISLLLLFLLRKQLPLLFQRLSDIELGKLRVGFKQPKSADTPIGKANVSALPTIPTSDSHSFYSHRYGFRISWPLQQWEFVPDPISVMQNLGVPNAEHFVFMVVWHEAIAQFRPNINIMVEPIGEMSLKDYLATSMGSMETQGFQIQLYRIDEKTNGAILVYLQPTKSGQLYHIARIATSGGLAYVVTASAVNEFLTPQLRGEMSAVLNSFEIVLQ